jgi:two-component system nitrogen regulation sensor histidine kinase NtrY
MPSERTPAENPSASAQAGASPAVELPAAERRRRRRELWIAAGVVAAILGLVAVEQRIYGFTEALPFGLGFLFLNALNVFLVFLLVYLILRNLVKLVFERRRGILGSHLNLKFVFAFCLIAAVPTAIIFLVSSLLITASIETWFSLEVDRALDQSRQVADDYYESSAQNALYYGDRIADQIKADRLLREDNLEDLNDFIQAKQRDYNLGVVEVFSATGEELVIAVNPEIPAANFSRPDSDLVRSALHGVATSRVQEAGGGSVIRGAVPIESSFQPGETVGAVVVNYFIPYSLARKVAGIRSALDQYRQLQPEAGHISRFYQLLLLLFSLVVLLFAIWWGFRIAKGVTGPIKALAEGTAEVARGNLDVVLETTTNDEVAFLVRSFNRMTQDLREARGGLERTNTELDQRRRYMEIVLRNIGAGVVSIDADGRVLTVNPAAQRLLGIPSGVGLVGQHLDQVITQPQQRDVVRELGGKLRAGVRESIRRQVQVPSGDEVVTLLVTVTLLKDEDGQALGTVIVLDDYSQLVKVQRMAAWQEVARRIAHEIKNPLTPIQLSAQRIRRRFRGRLAVEAEDARVFDECVDAITSQVDGLKLLVNEFSNFARLPAASPKPDELNRIVEETVASYEGTESVIFKTDLDPNLPSVEFDREQMRRLLTNLIDNAIAALRERAAQEPEMGSGRVEIRTLLDAPLQTVRLEVIDDGSGIPHEDRRRIFEPYFSTKRHGTGLGLAIVSRIVADHRGYVRVQDMPSQGTRIIVELPIRGGVS